MPVHVLHLPFDRSVGAAAFQRGARALVVFDVRADLDIKKLTSDPLFAGTDLSLLPDATVVAVTMPERSALRLHRDPTGWTVTISSDVAEPEAPHALSPRLVSGGIVLPAAAPGAVVSVLDPLTGDSLLVGTQLTSGEALAAGRKAPDFTLLPTWQGVLVQAYSDAVRLRATPEGFLISADGDGRKLAVSPPGEEQDRLTQASRLSRRFDFPGEPVDRLLRRMQGRLVAAAEAPPQSRLEPRKRVAESMLALGLGAEAAAALNLAVQDDARAADDPDVLALSSIAGLLAGRPADAEGLDDSRLDGTDEIRFWRAVREAGQHPNAAQAAQVFANTLPLLMSYPQPLRRRLLPLVAETMAQGGQRDAVAHLLEANAGDPSLDLARAMASEFAGGDPKATLAQYDALAASRDRKVSTVAAERAAELRLAKGLATPGQTADTLEKLLLAWRDDSTDVDRRLRIADLQSQAGQFRAALAGLREAEKIWPAQKDRLQASLKTDFARALTPQSQAGMSAFDMVALAEENGDLMPEGDAGQAMAERLSDRLTELDLPEQAAPLFERLAKSAPQGLARATFGSRLAAARLQMNDPAGAVDALATTTSETLPQDLLERRTLTFAAAVAAQHDLPSADSALRDLDSLAADETMAQLHENAKDWPNAVLAWSHAVERSITTDGPVTDAQATLLVRLASAATQAGDDATLATLRAQFATRIPAGKLADTFHLLTDQPIQSQGDLPLVSREMGMVAALAPTKP